MKKKLLAAAAGLICLPVAVIASTGAAHASTPAWTASCPANGSTSAAGCGSWDAGTTSGTEPGFLPDTPAAANLIDVNQDPWSGSQGAQSISANSSQDWSVTATDGPTTTAQILSYPNVSYNYFQTNTAASGYTAPPAEYDLNNITSLTSSYSETMPAVSDTYAAEAAYDIWLNNWDTEVMIWTDVHYQGVDCGGAWTPECSGDTLLGTYTYDGQKWSLYDNGGGINGYYMWMPDNGQAQDAVSEPSGTVDLKDMLAQTAVSGGFTSDSPLTQIAYGWELANTNGKPLTFQMNSFSVSINGGTVTPPTTPPTTPPATPPVTPPPPAGPVLSAGTAVSGASWKSTVTPGTWKVTLSGAGKLNGTSETVTAPEVTYPDSSLTKGSTYTATVQQEVSGSAAGKSGKITFIAG